MKHQAVRYDFTMRELSYFLFGKKRCPKCGGKLNRSKDFETVPGSALNSRSDPFFVPSAAVKHYLYRYTCQLCGSQYTLAELATSRKDKLL